MTTEELRTILGSSTAAFSPTGSRYICDPAPTDTDEDYVCLADATTDLALLAAGFEQTTEVGAYVEMPEFFAWRCGEFNVITTESGEFYRLFVEATEEAKRLNLTSKVDRVALFQRVLYNEPASAERAA